MALSGEGTAWLLSNPPPEECPAGRTDNVAGFARYYPRHQACHLGEMVWAVRAWRTGYVVSQPPTKHGERSRQA